MLDEKRKRGTFQVIKALDVRLEEAIRRKPRKPSGGVDDWSYLFSFCYTGTKFVQKTPEDVEKKVCNPKEP